jgi:sentrin-specific protease 1
VIPTSNETLNNLRQAIAAVVTQQDAVQTNTSKATKSGDGKKKLKRSQVKKNDDSDEDEDLFTTIQDDPPTKPTTSKSEQKISKPMTSNPPTTNFVEDLMKKKMTKGELELINGYMQVGKEKGMDDENLKRFRNEIMTISGNDSIFRDALQRLQPGIWLDDTLVNFYLNQCLSKRDTSSYLFYKTNFWNSLMNVDTISMVHQYEFDKVRWWNKGQNIFDMKKVFIPINVGNSHWVLVVIDIEKKKIQHYDSMESTSSKGATKRLENILRYTNDLYKNEYGVNMINDWVLDDVDNIPRQSNGELVEIEELLFTLP